MANKSVLELAVGTGSWDAGLKKAKQALDNFTQAQGGLQKALNTDSDKMQQFVRMMGQVDSTAKTAKGQLNDYKGTIETLTMQYNRMSEAQKKTIGQDYLQAIDAMKQKYQAVNEEIKAMNQSLNGAKLPDAPATGGGGLFGGGKLDGMLQVFGGNLMTKAAGAVASLGGEMVDMVQQGVEMAKAGDGIRIAFERLGRGDILDGLREATHGTVTDLELMKAAVKFNDFKLPVEELGTMLAFAQQKAKDTGQSVDYMVDSIVTGLGRKSLMILDNLGLSATEVKEKMKETGDMTKAVGAIIREQMAKSGDYVETAADRAAQANVSLQNKMEELGRKFAPLEEASNSLWTSMKIGILDIIGGPLTDLLNKLTQAGRMANAYGLMGGNAKVGRMTANLAGASEGNRQSIYQQQQERFWRYINPREQQLKDIRAWQSGQRGEALQGRINAITEKYGSLDATKIQAEVDAAKKMLADYQKAAQQILKPIKQDIEPTVTDPKSGKGGSSGGSATSINDKVLTGWQTAFNKSNLAIDGFQATSQPSEIWQALAKQAEEAADPLKDLTEAFKALNDSEGDTGEGNKSLKDDKKTEERISKLGSGLTAMASGLKAMGIELPDEINQLINIIQGVSSIIQGVNAVISAFSNTAMTANTAALIANTAALQVAATTNLIPFARGGVVHAAGGIVAGNTFSGDQIPAMLNAGEVVLNRAQTGALASQLQDNGGGNGRIVGVLRGEDIALVADRWGRRTGKGELAFFK